MTAQARRSRLIVWEENLLDPTRGVGSIPMLILWAVLVAPAFAQEPPRPNLLLQMTQPAESVSIDSNRRDDIRDRPAPPSTDKLRDTVRFSVGVGDPRCFPGEDGLGPGSFGGGPRRRR